jgi:hypothetical protein
VDPPGPTFLRRARAINPARNPAQIPYEVCFGIVSSVWVLVLAIRNGRARQAAVHGSALSGRESRRSNGEEYAGREQNETFEVHRNYLRLMAAAALPPACRINPNGQKQVS